MKYNFFKKFIIGCILIVLTLIGTFSVSRADIFKEYSILVDKMKVVAGDNLLVQDKNNLLVITNASFASINGNETVYVLDVISDKLGCGIGRKNLLLLRSSPSQPLYMFFFNKEKKRAGYLELSSKLDLKALMNLKPEEIFLKAKFFDLPWEEIIKAPQGWEKRLKDNGLGFNEFKFVSVALLWTLGLPQEVIKAIEIHDHLCPGVLSGYFVVKLILSELPPKEDSSYVWVASPAWCKEDLILSMLNTTPGKRNIFLFSIPEENKGKLKDKNAAGIIFQSSRKGDGGKGLVVGFNWEKLRADAGVSAELPRWEGGLITATFMLRNAKDYQKYAYVIKKFELGKGEKPSDYVDMGTNPWKKLGLWLED